MGIHDVDITQLIYKVAEELKKDETIKPPVWATFAKTGISKERPPIQNDWWFIRAASILRKLFILGPIGTIKLKVKYSAKKNMGVAPGRTFPASGNHIRKILQQLEKAGLSKQATKGAHKGRIITPKGQSLLEVTANQIMKDQGIVLPVKPKEEPKKKRATKKKADASKAKSETPKKVKEITER